MADIFFVANGIVVFFVQALIISMIIGDPRSLFLGVWDLQTFLLYIVVANVGLPIALFLILAGLFRFSVRTAESFIALLTAYLLARELDYMFVREALIDQLLLRIIMFLVLTGGLFALAWRFIRLLRMAFVQCGIAGIVLVLYFFVQTFPAFSPWDGGWDETTGARGGEGETIGSNVFIVSFERLVYRYFFDEGGNLLADQFPNLARMAGVSDVFHNAYANGTATWYALSALYTGRQPTATLKDINAYASPFGEKETWSELFRYFEARGHPVVFVMDVFTNRCDKRRNFCLTALGETTWQRRRWLIEAWFRALGEIYIPTGLLSDKLRLMKPWNTQMWQEIVHPAQLGFDNNTALGEQEMEVLLDIVEERRSKVSLYLHHNLMTHGLPANISLLETPVHPGYEAQLKAVRKELNTFDKTLGRFIDGLEALGLFDSSIIVLVSDTGNDKGADSFVTDQTKIMNTPELAHIIMMIKDRAQDRRRDFYSTVRQIDVVPTLLAKLNAEVKQGSFDGAPVLDPDDRWTLDERPVLLQFRTKCQYRLRPGDWWEKTKC